MADSLLQVSSANASGWSDSIQVANGQQLTGISYRITLNGRSSVRVVFPVYSPDDSNSIPQNTALMARSDWDNINIITDQQNGVTTNRNGLPLGAYDFTSTNPQVTEITFQLNIKNELTPYNDEATANCFLQYSTVTDGRVKWTTLPQSVTILIKKDLTPPVIIKFTAKHIVVASDESATLVWEAINATSIQIFNGIKLLDIPANQFKGTFTTDGLAASTTFTLTVRNDDSPASLSITVKVSENNALVPEKKLLFDGQKLMGLYPWGDKLYALILSSDNGSDNVFLWESYDGLNWQKTNFYSQALAFSGQTTNGWSTSSVNIATDFAGSPGLVFNDKLYLIGGSRFDSDFRSNRVFFLDFGNPQMGWQQDQLAGFLPRMGHACLVYNNEIWVIGGYDEQGCKNDVWTFDGSAWTCISATNPAFALKANRCMLSAMVNNGHIQIYGGFGSFPGVQDQTIADSYTLKDTWEPVALGANVEKISYVACTVVQNKGYNFIFNTIHTTQLQDRVQMLLENNTITLKDILVPTDFGMQEYIYNIQAVNFNDVVWLCILTKTDTIKSNVLSYFVYVNKGQQL